MKLIPVFIDLETHYSVTHSLTKMQPAVYAMHPDTEVISIAIKIGDKPTRVYFGEENIQKVLGALPWSRVYLIAHNMHFDGSILAWRFGVAPAMWGCTLSMARPFFGKTVGVSLKAVAQALNVGAKLDFDAVNAKGKFLKDFSPEEIEKMREYNRVDTDLCARIFKCLAKPLGTRELRLIDQTIRMWVEPQLEVDVPLLEATLATVRAEKRAMILKMADMLDIGWEDDEEARIEETRSALASQPKFKALLESLGVEVPMKASATAAAKGIHKLIPAISKTDEAFLELQEHDNPIVAEAARARLGVKSTQLETRMDTFIQVANACGGVMPVYLNYYGAHTGRASGGGKLNQQNMPRVGQEKAHGDALRMCLKAPKGWKLLVADSSGIELRMTHFWCGQDSTIEAFSANPKADLYKLFASKQWNITEDEVSKQQRFVAKIAELQLQYRSGAGAFQKVARIMGKLDLDQGECESIVAGYRSTHTDIVDMWNLCDQALTWIYNGREEQLDRFGVVHTNKQGLVFPSGRVVRYPSLHQESVEKFGRSRKVWVAGEKQNRMFLHGGVCVENVSQGLSADFMNDCQLEYVKTTGLPVLLQVHDEILSMAPEAEADAALAELQRIMRTPPKWFPELILYSEGDVGDRYGLLK